MSAELHLECPDCGEVIPVPVEGRVDTDDDGRAYLTADLDHSLVWLHSFDKHPNAKEGQ